MTSPAKKTGRSSYKLPPLLDNDIVAIAKATGVTKNKVMENAARWYTGGWKLERRLSAEITGFELQTGNTTTVTPWPFPK
jgi:hypothetical protein